MDKMTPQIWVRTEDVNETGATTIRVRTEAEITIRDIPETALIMVTKTRVLPEAIIAMAISIRVLPEAHMAMTITLVRDLPEAIVAFRHNRTVSATTTMLTNATVPSAVATHRTDSSAESSEDGKEMLCLDFDILDIRI